VSPLAAKVREWLGEDGIAFFSEFVEKRDRMGEDVPETVGVLLPLWRPVGKEGGPDPLTGGVAGCDSASGGLLHIGGP
jgi:hypothetical protein